MTSGAESFDAFVAARSRALLRTAWVFTGDWGHAEDLVQTALLSCWQRWSSIRRTDAPEVYVHTVIARTARRWNRRRWNSEMPAAEPPDAAIADVSDER